MTSRFVTPPRPATLPARRHPPRAARLATAVVVALALPGAAPPSPSDVAQRYQNTWAKDFVMDAPWRVVNATTPIPLLVVLKDCEADEIAALRWLRCRDLTGGAAVTLWLHDGEDERIGDDPPERDCCAWLTTVTEGHPALPDGTPLTPANLGYRAGDTITLEMSIRFRDNLLWDETATRILRVRVGDGPFPWPSGWHGGDLHTHSMFTNNIAEWGAPLPALRAAATAIGLGWVAVTDHSCDLDQTVDGPWSYVTREWQYTVQTPAGEQTFTRDVFANDGTTWGGLTAEIALADGPGLRLLRGVEFNLASVDPATVGRTLHALFLDAGYLASPLSGAPGERPVFPTVPAGLDALAAAGGFAFAAHPWDDLASEWAGVDLGVNGAVWGAGDFAAALPRDCLPRRGAVQHPHPRPLGRRKRSLGRLRRRPPRREPLPRPTAGRPRALRRPACAPALPAGRSAACSSPPAATPTATSTTPPTSASTTGPTTTPSAGSRPCCAFLAPGAPATPPPPPTSSPPCATAIRSSPTDRSSNSPSTPTATTPPTAPPTSTPATPPASTPPPAPRSCCAGPPCRSSAPSPWSASSPSPLPACANSTPATPASPARPAPAPPPSC